MFFILNFLISSNEFSYKFDIDEYRNLKKASNSPNFSSEDRKRLDQIKLKLEPFKTKFHTTHAKTAFGTETQHTRQEGKQYVIKKAELEEIL